MTSRQRTTFCAASVLLFSMISSILLLNHVDDLRPREIVDDTLYVASPKFIKRASLGFDGLMACIYWTRAVQYFGHRHLLRKTRYNELGPLLEITATLDPHLLAPYQFGSTFLAPAPPNGAGEPQRAIRLLEFGIQHNPDNWRLYYDLGFIYYTEVKDFKKAAEVFERGSKIPDAHPYLKILAANTAEHANDFATARLLWSAAYQNSYEADIRQNAVEHLRAIQVDEDISNLQHAVSRFSQANRRIPTSLWEIAAAEHLAGVPVDPDGTPYELSIDGQVLVANPDDFPFITKGTPPGYTPGTPRFHTKPAQ